MIERGKNLNIMVCKNTNGHRRTWWFDRTLRATLKNTCVASILCQWPTLMTPIQIARLQITYWTKKSFKKIICSQLGSCCLKNIKNLLIFN